MPDQPNRVRQAGGALRLRQTYRAACCLARERARRAGHPAAKIERARRRAQHAEQICYAVWREVEAAHREPSTPRPRAAQRQARPRARRSSASSTTSSADPGGDPPDSPGPPQLRLWRHPRYGLCSPAMLRLLVRAQAEEAQR